jgi:MerR family transcriptional regulator, heat shock protein HspR
MVRQPTPASATLLKINPTPPSTADPAEPEFGEGLPANAAFVISVAARLVGVHEQTLRYYERAGLLEPARSKGRIRLYSLYDLERVRQIRRLTDEMGVNLAGVEVIMRLTDHIRELEQRIDGLQDEVRRVRAASPRTPRGAAPWT